ncbi:MAG: hypothetical protein IKA22_12380 [Lentisphaeria bacterium]|nr:hypothetical protein [Lentisphaeria bacterium]
MQKILLASKVVLNGTFLVCHTKLEKQSRINKFGRSIPKMSNWHFEMALKAQKRLFVPSLVRIGTRVALRHLLRCKGDCAEITLFAVLENLEKVAIKFKNRLALWFIEL